MAQFRGKFGQIANYARAIHANRSWNRVELVRGSNLNIPVYSSALHYGLACFEGLKAYQNGHGDVHLFRPLENLERINRSAARLMMPQLPRDVFMEGLRAVVKSNRSLVPKHASGGSFYLRPLLFGHNGASAVKPPDVYFFTVFGFPAGTDDYYQSLRLVTSSYHRAARCGTGHIKAAGNYAGVFIAHEEATAAGYDECVYLDSVDDKYIEEIGAANFIAIEGDTLVIPQSGSILQSITQKTVVDIATRLLQLKAEHRKVDIDEIDRFDEVAACGTAAGLVFVTSITHKGKTTTFPKHTVFQRVKELLKKLQYGDLDDHPYFGSFNCKVA